MFTFQKIPVEIHYKILELLSKESIFQCMLVSKYWSSIAIPAYYNTIYLSGTNIEFLNSKLCLNDNDQDQQFAYGKLVKNLISPEFHCSTKHDSRFTHYNSDDDDTDEEYFLNDDDDEEEEEEEEEELDMEEGIEQVFDNDDDLVDFKRIPVFDSHSFLKLLSYLPNLKKIDLFTSAYYEFYMTILISQGKKYLQHIEDISIHSSFHELHFSTCYEFKETITHLEIYFTTYYINHLYGDPIYFLPHFENLTNLIIKNFERQDLTLFDILYICPQLNILEFDSNFDVLNQDIELSFKRLLISSKYKFKKLKVLDLTLPKLSNTYIHYLTNYTNLNNLSITLFDSHFDTWLNIDKKSLMKLNLNFLKKLSLLKNNLSFYTKFISKRSSNQKNQFIEIDSFNEFLEILQHLCPIYYEAYLKDTSTTIIK